jgi:hypothetical protein
MSDKRLKPGFHMVEDWYYILNGQQPKDVTPEQYFALKSGETIEYEGQQINVFDGPFRIMPPERATVQRSVDVVMMALKRLLR